MYHMESWLLLKLWGNSIPSRFPTLFGDLTATQMKHLNEVIETLTFPLVWFGFLPYVAANEELQ